MKRFIALDFEGSGKDPRRHAPTQIGLALFEDGDVTNTFETLIAPPKHYKTGAITREYDAVALHLTGFTLEQLDQAPSPAKVCGMIREWVAGITQGSILPLVAYNAGGYDWSMMSELRFLGGEYDRYAAKFLVAETGMGFRWCCAMELARKCLGRDCGSLDDVALTLGVPGRTTDKHGALEDAILAGRIWLALTQKVEAS